MFKSLKIENFRGFKSFELQHLGRVNLLVGANNSGKTSILEAIKLLCSGNLSSLEKLMIYRGEYLMDEDEINGHEDYELDIRHLFHQREISLDSKFSITGTTDGDREELIVSISERDTKIPEEIISRIADNDESTYFRLLFERLSSNSGKSNNSGKIDLVFQWTGKEVHRFNLPISIRGGCSPKYRQSLSRLRKEKVITKTQFVTPLSVRIIGSHSII